MKLKIPMCILLYIYNIYIYKYCKIKVVEFKIFCITINVYNLENEMTLAQVRARANEIAKYGKYFKQII